MNLSRKTVIDFTKISIMTIDTISSVTFSAECFAHKVYKQWIHNFAGQFDMKRFLMFMLKWTSFAKTLSSLESFPGTRAEGHTFSLPSILWLVTLDIHVRGLLHHLQ